MNTVKASEGTITSIDGTRTITVEEFDQLFDDASDEIDEFIDLSKARRVGNGVEFVIGRQPDDITETSPHKMPKDAAE